ncbi:hypothetical protein SGUI_0537 [Serinicoccus hydrothermalis]|uniref:Uncharacterized protein n=1 Tax=Serinicoccus hydrothermalis TaxID=1758689 RepID=A0A1B1N914_9MICO|nr:DUF6541 family protein [Serinicoccus hydrothermalis]ANS77933.1 hypothetical protein SGUI_0537 [Serinicoccus hydrothermalis]
MSEGVGWAAVAPGILALAALWVLPGYAVLRALGARGLLALGAAPAVTTGLAGVLAIGYALLGVPWRLLTFGLGALLAVVAAGLVGAALGTIRDPRGVTVAGERALRPSERGWLALTWSLGGGTLAATMMTGMGRADQPPQAWDAVFHLNSLWFVRESGDASSLGGLSPMYADQAAPFYPAVWHSLVAIAPGFAGVTEAANASSVVLGSVVWIAGLVALARVVWPARALPTVLVPVLAATFVTFPAIAVSMLAVWPFALSTACLPGTIALLIASLRGVLTWRMHLSLALGLAWAVAGVVLAHASGLFSLALLALPLLSVLLARQLRRQFRLGRRAAAIGVGVGGAVGVLAVAAFLLTFPPVLAIMDYQRGGQDSYLPGLGSLAIDHPLVYVYKITSVNLVVTLLVWLGIALTLRWRHARWLVVSLVAAVVLTLLAAGPPEQPLRVLAGFWYTQASRINQLVLVPAIMLAAGAGGWLCGRLTRVLQVRVEWVAAGFVLALVVLTSGLRWTSQVQVMASTYTTYPIAWGTMLEPEEIAMIDRAADTLPDDAVVLGEPVAGSPYLLHRAGVDVVFPQLSPIPDSPARAVLEDRFDQWATDPTVCEAVRELGVTHVYADSLSYYDELNAKYEAGTQGLYLLDPAGGKGSGGDAGADAWTLVDEGGHASLWEFTGCS